MLKICSPRYKKINENIKVGDYVRVEISHESRRIRRIKGTVTSITKYFILVKTQKYKECFLRNDLKCGRVKIEVLK
ncbi:hypothetical protein G4W71_19285 [Clostridium botulinum]|uniref:hypothetical protein n=1 Tax=Clostridium botulinum TaxID=1491 RepID=UPI001788E244|nr:hypothetical protein [Clostridium botulinum]MBE1306138.1 hypothetical protein [Clostridium botulinum]